MDRLGVGFAGDVKIDALDCPGKGLATLEDREYADSQERAEDPDDADRNPAGKELLAEDVAGTIEGHGPENEERKSLVSALLVQDSHGVETASVRGKNLP